MLCTRKAPKACIANTFFFKFVPRIAVKWRSVCVKSVCTARGPDAFTCIRPDFGRQIVPCRSRLADPLCLQNCCKQCTEHRSSFAIGNNYQNFFFLLRHVTIDTILLSRLELFSSRLMQMSADVENYQKCIHKQQKSANNSSVWYSLPNIVDFQWKKLTICEKLISV